MCIIMVQDGGLYLLTIMGEDGHLYLCIIMEQDGGLLLFIIVGQNGFIYLSQPTVGKVVIIMATRCNINTHYNHYTVYASTMA